MSNLVLNTIELTSVTRPAPYQGAPSTEDYNNSQEETLNDLTSISEFINNVLIPMFRALPPDAVSGLEGRNIYSDTTDQTVVFTDSSTGEPLAIADSLRTLYSIINTQSTTLSNINIQVGQLSQKLSSTNQNDISITLQNITSSINTVTNQQNSINAAITSLQSMSNKMQAARESVAVAANSTSTATITWPNAFLDNNYTVSLSDEDASNSTTIEGFVYESSGVGIVVTVSNTSGSTQSVIINAIAVHD